MNIVCVHCGQQFSITAEQLGRRGKCPHCLQSIQLPKAEQAYTGPREHQRPSQWFETSFSGVGSLIAHLLVLISLALIPWESPPVGTEDRGEVVSIAPLNPQPFDDRPLEWELPQSTTASIQPISSDAAPATPVTGIGPPIATEFDVQLPSVAGAVTGGLDLEPLGGRFDADAAQRDFGQLVNQLKRDGLDIVITFDSTGSMESEIRQVKSKIERIGGALFKLVPKTRISVCTFRDDGDQYIVKGLKLTDNLSQVSEYLYSISAAGGGDEPEAVDAGLNWAINQNMFRPRARKVVLLFGDAPPHPSKRKTCLMLAGNFRRQQGGTVCTVTCHSEAPLPDFLEIAQAGGGESFLTKDEREIMTQLMVLVFGSQHRAKVVEALGLMQQ